MIQVERYSIKSNTHIATVRGNVNTLSINNILKMFPKCYTRFKCYKNVAVIPS